MVNQSSGQGGSSSQGNKKSDYNYTGGDNEFYDYIRNNQVDTFISRINSAYVSTLRFTNYNWTCLQLALTYDRMDILNAILEIDSSVQFISTRDRNGETALHTAAGRGDVVNSVKLLNRGATLTLKNNVLFS